MDCIFNCCSDFPRRNAPYLEPSEQIKDIFPASLHKCKHHIFQNLSKFSIHILRPFKYKNTYELCENIPDKYKKGILMANKCFVLHEEITDALNGKYYIPTIAKLSFHLAHVRIIGSMECGKNRNDCFHANASKLKYS